jgi:outer membrane protein OmpA-like peptidoglycan-associated protein
MNNLKLVTGSGLLLVLGACASTPIPTAALDTARTAVRTAEADPNVAKYAAVDLDTAKKQLDIAESAALKKKADAVAQPAYMATQYARLAEARASAKADDARVQAGQQERDRIQLAARNREIENARLAAQAANAQSSKLQAEIDALKAQQTERGLVMTFGDVLFDTGKAELNPSAQPRLDQLAQFLQEHPSRRVEIDGYTDNVGSVAFNQQLSLTRADAVETALVRRGIDPSRIATEAYGKSFPVADNSNPSGRQLNRRVEVVIGNADGSNIAARTASTG